MRFLTVIAALVFVGAASAQQTFTVVVGGNGTLTFNPPSINASVNDIVAFQFQSKNHTVTQSTFAAPCQNMTTPAAGVDSGFLAVPANTTSFPQWSFTMTNASAPLWFYCRQEGHCQKGMVFAVNPTAAKSFDAFQKAAMSSSPSNSSNSSSTAGSSSTPSSSAPSASTTNSAMKYSGSAATFLAAVGLAAGLLL